MTVLRDAVLSDAENLAALSIQVWLHTYAKAGIRNVFARYVLTRFTAERLAGEIRNKAKQIVVAEVAGHLVGYVQLRFDAHCPVRKIVLPEVETLYVQEHFVGQGLGGARSPCLEGL